MRVIKKRARANVFMNNTAVGISSSRNSYWDEKSDAPLSATRALWNMCSWRENGSPAGALQSYSGLPAHINSLRAPHRLNGALPVGKTSLMAAIIARIAWCDTGRADTIVHRGMDGLTEEGVT